MLCELCRCEEAHNLHHLIPRTLHTNKWFKKRYTREEMQQGIDVCKSCHAAVHDLIPDEKELAVPSEDTELRQVEKGEESLVGKWRESAEDLPPGKRQVPAVGDDEKGLPILTELQPLEVTER